MASFELHHEIALVEGHVDWQFITTPTRWELSLATGVRYLFGAALVRQTGFRNIRSEGRKKQAGYLVKVAETKMCPESTS